MKTGILQEILERIKQNELQLKQIAKQVAELHAAQTGSLYTSPKHLTPKQKRQTEAEKENAYLQELRRQAHRRILNGW